MTGEEFSLFGLFLSAFLSSTVLPGSSEVVLAALATHSDTPLWRLLTVATVGNTLGGMTSWGLGWMISWRYPLTALSKPPQRQAVERVRQWGSPVLLLSWVPFLGDPLCVASGWLRISWIKALLFILLGKAFRYAVILALLAPQGVGES